MGGSPDFSPVSHHAHAHKLFEEMLTREKKMCGEWVVFYHSYNSPAIIYELNAAIGRVLFNFRSQHACLPRILKAPFSKLPDAEAAMKAFPSWPDNDHNQTWKSVGISCTTSLVSTDPEATPTHVFLSGYQGAPDIGVQGKLEKLLGDCGTPKKHITRLAKSVLELAQKHGLPQATHSGLQGHLLQIFVNRGCADRWAYASLPRGFPDRSRMPIGKHLASAGPICGQVRLVVDPSAFMRAGAVRMYIASADENYHNNRTTFHEEIHKVLSPILGSPDVREAAARGVYGGTLPGWYKDLETVKSEARAQKEKAPEDNQARCDNTVDDSKRGMSSSELPPRLRCRYGAKCYRAGPEHVNSYCHPGDPDWDAPSSSSTSIVETNSATGGPPKDSFRGKGKGKSKAESSGSDGPPPTGSFGEKCKDSGSASLDWSAYPPTESIGGKAKSKGAGSGSVDHPTGIISGEANGKGSAEPPTASTGSKGKSKGEELASAENPSTRTCSKGKSKGEDSVAPGPPAGSTGPKGTGKGDVSGSTITPTARVNSRDCAGQETSMEPTGWEGSAPLAAIESSPRWDDDVDRSAEEELEHLDAWLAELKLTKYTEAVRQWAEENGACCLEEVIDNLEDLADSIKLKKLERVRLMKESKNALTLVSTK